MKWFKRTLALMLGIALLGILPLPVLADTGPDSTVEEIKAEYDALLEKFENGEVILGDADGNGRINTTDARITLQKVPRRYRFDPNNIVAYGYFTDRTYDPYILLIDVDGNYRANTTDARMILQYAAGRIDSFDRTDLS